MPFLSDQAAVRMGYLQIGDQVSQILEMRLQKWTKKHTFRSLTFKTGPWPGKRDSTHFVLKYLLCRSKISLQ